MNLKVTGSLLMSTAEDGELPDLECIEHKEVRPHGQVLCLPLPSSYSSY